MKAPVVPANDLEDVPKIIRGYKANGGYGVTPELHKGLLQAYYASISYMDAQVGKVIRALEQLGHMKDTIIVFSSDHGYLLGEHHKFQKQHLFEESTRVPFILSVPWMKDTHGNQTKKITELVDLYPTLAELAGLLPQVYFRARVWWHFLMIRSPRHGRRIWLSPSAAVAANPFAPTIGVTPIGVMGTRDRNCMT